MMQSRTVLSSRGAFLAVAVLMQLSTALADAPAVSGFVTSGTGELQGRVTDLEGAPTPHAVVHIVPESGGAQVVTADERGNYRAKLRPSRQTYVFIEGVGRIVGMTSSEGEVIEIREIVPPAVPAKPRRSPALIPPYSDAAIDADRWAKAWLMLHVNEHGRVTHAKLLNSPGLELDAIALRQAFDLEFEPARDRPQRPMRSLIVWSFEWPPYWWMRKGKHLLTRVPDSAAKVSCRRADRPSRWDRDCSRPDIKASLTRPWLARTEQ
jgi:protocatechuate 3,4-dioxygenase beta subunit